MRYKAIVSYDGTNYSGWQIQPDKPSIQGCLNSAIKKITGEDVNVTGSGRTDGKVHAQGQVFHFDSEKTIKNFKAAINSQLPDDIYVRSVEEVDENFHARFSACYKHYDYLINNGEFDPLLRNYTSHVRQKLDLYKMEQAAKIFIGEHDFCSFNSTKLEENENQVRTIYQIAISKQDDLIRISFYGNGFLRYMVRMISQTLIEAGLGKISEEGIKEILEKKDKMACHFNGEPQGLYLVEVGYQPF